jgi:RNA polymerase sigma-70 factor (ECF subfamily)
MGEQDDFMELAERAQQGDKEALNRLAELSASRLRVYVYRLTYQDDLAQDIVQETMLEMVKVLGKLKRTDRFLPWLYGIATNKLRHFYRSEAAHRRVNATRSERQEPSESRDEGLENLLSQELKEIIGSAIQALKTRHRAVLIMRCYDGLSYAEIAESMGTSEFGTRMLFIRAKKALQKQLSRNGLGKASLLAVLVLFGKMTAPTKAAAAQITVTATTVNAGLAAGAVGLVASKAALVSLTTAGALTLGTVAVKTYSDNMEVDPGPVGNGLTHRSKATANNINKHVFVWLDGPKGPIITRSQSDDSDNQSEWIVKQTRDRNFYYSREKGVVEQNNHRAWNEHVMRLPTDHPNMIAFLAEMDGYESKLTGGITARGKDFLVSVVDGPNQPVELETTQQRGVEHQDLFQSDWEAGMKIIDNRDEMHKRGWAYFKADGHIRGEHLSATGSLPFFYSTYKDGNHRPWMRLRVGEKTLVDTDSGAYAYDASSKARVRFNSRSFFKGFARPWEGLHTLDTIRRDAAERRVPFKTEISKDRSTGIVVLALDPYTVVYTIDMDADWVQRIDINEGQTSVGKMIFQYVPSLTANGASVNPPRTTSRSITHPGIGVNWIAQLVSGTLCDLASQE